MSSLWIFLWSWCFWDIWETWAYKIGSRIRNEEKGSENKWSPKRLVYNECCRSARLQRKVRSPGLRDACYRGTNYLMIPIWGMLQGHELSDDPPFEACYRDMSYLMIPIWGMLQGHELSDDPPFEACYRDMSYLMIPIWGMLQGHELSDDPHLRHVTGTWVVWWSPFEACYRDTSYLMIPIWPTVYENVARSCYRAEKDKQALWVSKLFSYEWGALHFTGACLKP